MTYRDPTLLDDPFEVATEAIDRFEADGFVHLQGVLDAATINHYEPEITSKVIELNTMHLPLEQRSTYDKAFLQIENLWEHSDLVRELVFGPRLARIAADLLGVRGVRIYHDQALYKEPGGGHTPWHVDQYYWPLSSDRTCTVWIPLQDTPLELGPLSFAAGSHRLTLGRDQAISDDSEEALARAVSDARLSHVVSPYELGDVSYHFGWTVHRADANSSDRPRKVMTVIYMDADIRVTEPLTPPQARERARWLNDAEPGTVPDGVLTPVLYER